MIQFGTGQDFETGAECAAFRIVGCVDQAGGTSLDDRPGAHGARLQRYVKRRFREAIIFQLSGGFAKNHNLGVGSRVAVSNCAVAAASQHFVSINKHGANRHFTSLRARPRFFQGQLHEFLIGHLFPTENITLSPLLNCSRDCVCQLAPRILDIRALAKETVNMKELLARLFQVDVLKSMGVTFRTQHPANVYTEQYPLERPMVAERYRGAPRLNNHPESGETLCNCCNLWAVACPENLLVARSARDDDACREVLWR